VYRCFLRPFLHYPGVSFRVDILSVSVGQMSLRNRTRLHQLCSRVLAETDPQKLASLQLKIDDILSETVAELGAMLNEVEQLLRRSEQLSRIQLVERTEVPRLHEVGFYSGDRQLLEHLTQFVGAALTGGDAAIILATESHRESLLPRLQAFGVDIGGAIEQGRYVALDVVDALATFMRNDMPDPVRFMKVFHQVIVTAAKATKTKDPRVAIFGEGVHFLCAQGNAEAAIGVEKLCNQVIKAYDVDILCGYFPPRIAGGMDRLISRRICEEHSAVHFF
jgi:MEDS: MEthanogen/methylotroph, DcmR Sensory domain